MVCLGESGIETILAKAGMKPAKSRVSDLSQRIKRAADLVADSICNEARPPLE